MVIRPIRVILNLISKTNDETNESNVNKPAPPSDACRDETTLGGFVFQLVQLLLVHIKNIYSSILIIFYF